MKKKSSRKAKKFIPESSNRTWRKYHFKFAFIDQIGAVPGIHQLRHVGGEGFE